jgi:hypothetical protein
MCVSLQKNNKQIIFTENVDPRRSEGLTSFTSIEICAYLYLLVVRVANSGAAFSRRGREHSCSFLRRAGTARLRKRLAKNRRPPAQPEGGFRSLVRCAECSRGSTLDFLPVVSLILAVSLSVFHSGRSKRDTRHAFFRPRRSTSSIAPPRCEACNHDLWTNAICSGHEILERIIR